MNHITAAVSLDFETILVCLFIVNFFTVLFMLSHRSRYTKGSGLRPYIIAKLIQLLAWMLLLLDTAVDLRGVQLTVMLICLAGGMMEAFSLLKLLGVYNAGLRRSYYRLAGISGAGVLLLAGLYPSAVQAGALTAAAGAGMMAYPVYLLCMKLGETPLQKLIGLLYGLAIIALLGQAVHLLYAQSLAGTAASGWLQEIFYIGLYLLMFLGTAGYMLLSRERTYAELERVATYDELTGILNRRAFVVRARPLIAAAAREDVPFSFLLLDVDHFKQINDTFGHETGDKVLWDFSRKIEAQLSSNDLFGRFGGEEFAVLLHRADETASTGIAERLRRCVLGAVIDDTLLPYTVSIGVVTICPEKRVPLDRLYKLTDLALYEAKQTGRNRVVRTYEHSSLLDEKVPSS
ncbi:MULTISPECIES: GGDEF domain-containing protein [unclassified Paenibacillus]|uniref:GGDEF domain-containing protein n=1 Tax=unclassified Paenibacillus TaxID=185978 RepID=UPI0024066CA9|nr:MULTISPECIES: GGDEF domain-containing protein [unclassified Paenibacillus]MDF9850618.1 diguanylate cyclase (GGDEF)-like protein [Paenibacillus sp. PastM-2]MDH6482468.1 diguanylate cyclase (GGDEF)-like protein [Paenibacillus sp. PastH-2]MDF9844013.1 diguanylate cyclase (GGDEF)-like protein [Paenibacillus sp. PastF-2]MDF9857232.1 diguanylate cyclase (GGDEF)-like protein [Paenibacillus sp. PastF-1]MDH6509929.1 diguanylate cyclase (GGDEF)-like protein [Paenibacillus sp. PastM-3]